VWDREWRYTHQTDRLAERKKQPSTPNTNNTTSVATVTAYRPVQCLTEEEQQRLLNTSCVLLSDVQKMTLTSPDPKETDKANRSWSSPLKGFFS